MGKRRRKIFFIDKVFQKKLLTLFLGINIVIVIANIAFYLFYLKNEVEKNLFKSHINIENINEIIEGNVIKFNIFLGSVSLILIIIFYSIIRKKLKLFFNRISKVLISRQERTTTETFQCVFKEEFHEIADVMENFIKKIDHEIITDSDKVIKIKEKLENITV